MSRYIYTWRRKWQPILVFLPGQFNEQRSLAGYSPWGSTDLDMTEHAHTYTHLHYVILKAFSSDWAVLSQDVCGNRRGGVGRPSHLRPFLSQLSKLFLSRKTHCLLPTSMPQDQASGCDQCQSPTSSARYPAWDDTCHPREKWEGIMSIHSLAAQACLADPVGGAAPLAQS